MSSRTEILDYFQRNRATWNARVDLHLKSDFYDLPGFTGGITSLNSIELELLGEVADLDVLHLQCHFGQDSLSLARMGARVVGVDFSERAIEEAEHLNKTLELDATFVLSNVYDVPESVPGQFDLVYTSYGVISWLPDLKRWAEIIAEKLKPGGRLVFVEFHPVVWMFDDDFTALVYDYASRKAIIESGLGSYTDGPKEQVLESIGWNHGLGDVLSALLGAGLCLDSFAEVDYSPYNCLAHMVEFEPGKYRIGHLKARIPMVYALSASRPQSRRNR